MTLSRECLENADSSFLSSESKRAQPCELPALYIKFGFDRAFLLITWAQKGPSKKLIGSVNSVN